MNIIMNPNKLKKSGILCKSCRRRIEFMGTPFVVRCRVCGTENIILKNADKIGIKY